MTSAFPIFCPHALGINQGSRLHILTLSFQALPFCLNSIQFNIHVLIVGQNYFLLCDKNCSYFHHFLKKTGKSRYLGGKKNCKQQTFLVIPYFAVTGLIAQNNYIIFHIVPIILIVLLTMGHVDVSAGNLMMGKLRQGVDRFVFLILHLCLAITPPLS